MCLQIHLLHDEQLPYLNMVVIMIILCINEIGADHEKNWKVHDPKQRKNLKHGAQHGKSGEESLILRPV